MSGGINNHHCIGSFAYGLKPPRGYGQPRGRGVGSGGRCRWPDSRLPGRVCACRIRSKKRARVMGARRGRFAMGTTLGRMDKERITGGVANPPYLRQRVVLCQLDGCGSGCCSSDWGCSWRCWRPGARAVRERIHPIQRSSLGPRMRSVREVAKRSSRGRATGWSESWCVRFRPNSTQTQHHTQSQIQRPQTWTPDHLQTRTHQTRIHQTRVHSAPTSPARIR